MGRGSDRSPVFLSNAWCRRIRHLLSCIVVKLKKEDFKMEKKRTPQSTASVCLKKILVFVAMALIWYIAQMMVYAEVIIILMRLNGRF